MTFNMQGETNMPNSDKNMKLVNEINHFDE